MRGNRRTKNTFVAVESRSLTEFYAWRVPAANPRFPPTIGHSLAASLPPTRSSPTTRFSTTTIPNPHPGMMEGRSRGSDPSTSSIDGNLTADRKARLPLRSSAKIAMKASRHLQSFSSFLVPLVWSFFLFFFTTPWNEKQKTTDAGIISFSSVVVPLNTFGEIFSKSQRLVYLLERTSPSRSEFVDNGTTQREYLKRISVAWHFESKRQMLREIGDKRFDTVAISLRRFMSVCLNE